MRNSSPAPQRTLLQSISISRRDVQRSRRIPSPFRMSHQSHHLDKTSFTLSFDFLFLEQLGPKEFVIDVSDDVKYHEE